MAPDILLHHLHPLSMDDPAVSHRPRSHLHVSVRGIMERDCLSPVSRQLVLAHGGFTRRPWYR